MSNSEQKGNASENPLGIVAELAGQAERAAAAGDRGQAGRLYLMAGQAAARQFANDQARAFFDQALAHLPDTDPRQRIQLLFAREQLLSRLGQTDAQAADLAALEALVTAQGSDAQRALVAARQAVWREATGDLAAAVTVAGMAARLALLAGSPQAEATARLAWGRALLRQSHYPEAGVQLKRALVLSRAAGDERLAADCLRFQGVLANDQGRYAEAVAAYRQAEALYEQMGDRQGRAHIHNNLGHIHLAQGKIMAAQRHWEEARGLYQELGDAEGLLRTAVNLGAASGDVGQYDAARTYHEDALVQAERLNSPFGECMTRLNLGLVAHYQERNQDAVTQLTAAHAIAMTMGSERLQGHALAVLGHAYLALDNVAAASDAYWQALAIWEALALPALAAETRSGLARVALKKGHTDQAAWFVDDILEHAGKDPGFDGAELPVRIYLTCYQVLAALGDRRAEPVLAAGRSLLAARVDAIADPALQESLRHGVPAHREILAA